MRNCWNSAEVRQPEATADHTHTWASHWATQETFLNDDLSGATRGQFLGGSPARTETHPVPDGLRKPFPGVHRQRNEEHIERWKTQPTTHFHVQLERRLGAVACLTRMGKTAHVRPGAGLELAFSHCGRLASYVFAIITQVLGEEQLVAPSTP